MPVLGAAMVAELRALFALAFLVPWVVFVTRDAIRLREHWRDQLAVCMVNNALPFICFAYAATALPASYLAVMNGMVPLWSALISVPVLKEPLDARRIIGFVLGIAGVALIVKLGPIELTPRIALASVVGMVGAAFWGWAGVVIRQRTERVAPISLALGSILFAAAFLVPWVLLVTREPLMLGANWRDHFAVCMVNNVLPFICFAYAATALPASYLAVMNGMVPLWSAVISAPVLKEALSAWRVAGFLLGIAGVALIVKLGPIELTPQTALAAAAGVAGAAFWGWAGVVIRQRTGRVPPISLAAGSILFAAAILAPMWVEVPRLAAWTPGATAALVALGALCSGVAYLPFFTLVRDIGPTRTLTVGLAVPVLGILWGWLLLGETITASMLAGAAFVVAALALVMKH